METDYKKIVCLGGGIGTVNLIRGLKRRTPFISVVISMADDGGSSGRLRRLFHMQPPGDLVSCMAALAKDTNKLSSDLLTYRFPGDRYGKDEYLAGHKMGNLMMAALFELTGNFKEAIDYFQRLFDVPGEFLPATSEQVTISVKTIEGKEIVGEENIDLGKYDGERVLDTVSLIPENVHPGEGVIDAIEKAEVIIAGPGDLYTTILPVLIIPGISEALQKSSATKIFVVNVANKPFETKGYHVSDFIRAIKKHLRSFPFEKIIVNNNYKIQIPPEYQYTYVTFNTEKNDKEPDLLKKVIVIEKDLVNNQFPLYHGSEKLAKAIFEAV